MPREAAPVTRITSMAETVRGNPLRNIHENPPNGQMREKKSETSEEHIMEEIDSVPPNTEQSRHEALLYVFDQNDAVIKMIIEGRS